MIIMIMVINQTHADIYRSLGSSLASERYVYGIYSVVPMEALEYPFTCGLHTDEPGPVSFMIETLPRPGK